MGPGTSGATALATAGATAGATALATALATAGFCGVHKCSRLHGTHANFKNTLLVEAGGLLAPRRP